MRHGSILSSLAMLGLVASASAATLVVDINGTGQFIGIQPAIDAAADGDTVLVKAGRYPIAEPITFKGKGIMVRGEAGPDATTVAMAALPTDATRASVVVFESGETNAATLEGFTLTGGKGVRERLCGGGGAWVRNNASPTLTNCTLAGNTAEAGGGVLCTGGSATLTDCVIAANQAVGVACVGGSPTLTKCTISGNTGNSGGGVYCDNASPMLADCTISENKADSGGGMHCESGAPSLTDCTISGNAANGGGGMYCYGGFPTLANCTISGNTANGGGGVHCDGDSPMLTNCIISGNAADHGGGIHSASGSPRLTNCTISGNTASAGGGLYYYYGLPTLTNCIVWGNTGGAIERNPDARGLVVSYSCVESIPLWTGEGNTNRDPRLMRPGRWEKCDAADFHDCIAHEWDSDTGRPSAWHRWVFDYHLQPSSPCIDAGISQGAPTTDFEGTARPCRSSIDIGAYEYCGVVPEFRRGDANLDGALNIADAIFVLQFLFARGTRPSCSDSADSNDDGRLDIADVVRTLGHLFTQAGPLPEPFGACGLDATLDDLDCGGFPACEAP